MVNLYCPLPDGCKIIDCPVPTEYETDWILYLSAGVTVSVIDEPAIGYSSETTREPCVDSYSV